MAGTSDHGVTRADALLLTLSAVAAIATQTMVRQYTNPEPRSPLAIRQLHQSTGELPREPCPAIDELASHEAPAQSLR